MQFLRSFVHIRIAYVELFFVHYMYIYIFIFFLIALFFSIDIGRLKSDRQFFSTPFAFYTASHSPLLKLS